MEWIRAELHCHTRASDGEMSPEELVDAAVKRGYAAIALSDHNTVSNVAETIEAGAERGLVVVPAIEWTTFWGHVTVLGGKSKVDWRTITRDNIADKLDEAKRAGDVTILAHPKRAGYPFCGGCRALFDIEDITGADGYEVWSRFNPAAAYMNVEAEKEYEGLTDAGCKIAAVYGYDWHRSDLGAPPYACTYLGVNETNVLGVLEAIRNRRTFASSWLKTEFVLTGERGSFTFGDCAPKGTYEVTLRCRPDEAAPYLPKARQAVFFGSALEEKVVAACPDGDVSTRLNLRAGCLRVSIIGTCGGSDGKLISATPIWID